MKREAEEVWGAGEIAWKYLGGPQTSIPLCCLSVQSRLYGVVRYGSRSWSPLTRWPRSSASCAEAERRDRRDVTL